MARFINALLGRGYSYDDLLKESASLLSNPKRTRLWTHGLPAFHTPGDWPKFLSMFDGRNLEWI